MNRLNASLLQRAGFSGSDFSNTQIGTCHETALQNLIELAVEQCIEILEHSMKCDHYTGELMPCERNTVLVNQIDCIKEHFSLNK